MINCILSRDVNVVSRCIIRPSQPLVVLVDYFIVLVLLAPSLVVDLQLLNLVLDCSRSMKDDDSTTASFNDMLIRIIGINRLTADLSGYSSPLTLTFSFQDATSIDVIYLACFYTTYC